MFDFFKKKKEEKKETSLFERQCYLFNEFYASMYQDFCFASEIPSYEEKAEQKSHEQRHKDEGAIERAILNYTCRETKND